MIDYDTVRDRLRVCTVDITESVSQPETRGRLAEYVNYSYGRHKFSIDHDDDELELINRNSNIAISMQLMNSGLLIGGIY